MLLLDSGVDWIGGIPNHWKCVPLKWFISISSGDFILGDKISEEKSNDQTVPVIGGNGVMGFANSSNTSENEIIIGRVGALCGNVHIFRESTWVTDNALKVKIGTQFTQDYLTSTLSSLNLNKLANKNAQPLITGSMIKSQKIPLPPNDEQRKIQNYIEMLANEFEIAKKFINIEIAKLTELKASFIFNTVTGKIKV